MSDTLATDGHNGSSPTLPHREAEPAPSDPPSTRQPVVDRAGAAANSMDSSRHTDSPALGPLAYQVVIRNLTHQKISDAALKSVTDRADNSRIAIISTTADGIVDSWDAGAVAIFGRDAAMAVGLDVGKATGTELSPATIVAHEGMAEVSRVGSNGSELHLRIFAAEKTDGFALVYIDETQYWWAEQRVSKVVDALAEGVVVVTSAGAIESVNASAEVILGDSAARLVGSDAAAIEMFAPSGSPLRGACHPIASTLRRGRQRTSEEFKIRRASGTEAWIALSCRRLDPNRRKSSIVVSMTDITSQRIASNQLEFAATHDDLTGLANRAATLKHLEDMTSNETSDELNIAVYFIDLDNFKEINDSYGHLVGDEVLREVGRRLRYGVRAKDVAGRYGGDEFVIVTADAASSTGIYRGAERLRTLFADPFVVTTAAGRQIHLTACIGAAARQPSDSRSATELLRDADSAMYRAKAKGPGMCELSTVSLREDLQRQLRLEQDLHEAVRGKRLTLAYQPIVDLVHGRTVAVEALMRWVHPDRGEIRPPEFIPLAEESALIGDLSAYAFNEAIGDACQYPGDIVVSINLSARQFDDPRLKDLICAATRIADVPLNRVCLEITEQTLMTNPRSAEVIKDLRQLGVRFAIDDFGTGYSSLTQLLRLPIETLKIGQTVVAEIDRTDTQSIVAGIVAMAHASGLRVVAKGVENLAQLTAVTALGCDQAQGYLFGRPQPASHAFTVPTGIKDYLN